LGKFTCPCFSENFYLATKLHDMNEIVVGIDFSKGALNALKYASVLAKGFGCSVTMLWIDKPHNPSSIYLDGENHRQSVHDRFETLIAEYTPVLGKGNIQYKIRTGKVYDEISTHAKLNNSQFVVVGTHGISGFEELWIGSNANRVVSIAPCPTFTLRQDYTIPATIKKIILPIDNTNDTLLKVPFAKSIAKAFDAEIILLRLYTTNVSILKKKVDNLGNEVQKDLESNKIKVTNIEKLVVNLTGDLLSVIDKTEADLLIIMTEQQNRSANIMLGESAQQVVNNSPVPVISIHPDDKP
jgi:nucleotide-binding universal stress UspA family protein